MWPSIGESSERGESIKVKQGKVSEYDVGLEEAWCQAPRIHSTDVPATWGGGSCDRPPLNIAGAVYLSGVENGAGFPTAMGPQGAC